MERIIRLGKFNGKFENNAPITFLSKEKITLKISSYYALGDESVITFKNGDVELSYRLTKEFDIPQEVLFSGWLDITVTLFTRGQISKKWSLLPIKLIELEAEVNTCDNEMKSFDERISSLESDTVKTSDFESLKKLVEELTEKHNKLADIVALLKEN